jgi:alpha-galactosidase
LSDGAIAEHSPGILGVWLVEPRSPQGVLPSTLTFTGGDGNPVTGVWSANAGSSRYPIDDVEVHGEVVSFKVTYPSDRLMWSGKLEGSGRLIVRPANIDLPAAVTTLRRLSPRELAKLQAEAPISLIAHKLPVPRLRDLAPNGLARTPPMGWSSWNHFLERIDDRTVREIADALVSSGLRDVGYVYVNIDDGWQGRRDQQGELHANSKFPDMKGLAEFIHRRGLKLGLYSSPGPATCAGYVGSHGYEIQDAQTFARWGVDYLKYDLCSAEDLYRTEEDMRALYQKMGEALQATGRPIVYGLCEYGLSDVGSWGHRVGGNSWRVSEDIWDNWARMAHIGFETHGNGRDAGPGGWNDPDMLEVGNGGMSTEEYRTHLTLWSMLAAPLILGNDVRHMDSTTQALLLNKEVIAIDQDPLGMQGRRATVLGDREVWIKVLSDRSTAVALFNRGPSDAIVQVNWGDIGLDRHESVRDLWKHEDLGEFAEGYQTSVPSHGAMLLKVYHSDRSRSSDDPT